MGRRAKGIEDLAGSEKLRPSASVFFGAAVNRLRKRSSESHLSTDSFARILGIGGSTLRMIESGALIPPVLLGYTMSRAFSLNLATTFAALGFVNTIDLHETRDGRISAAGNMANQEPRLAFLADAVVSVVRRQAPAGSAEDERSRARDARIVDGLIEFMSQPLSTSIPSAELDVLRVASQDVSPLLIDALAQFASRLKSFQSNMTLDGLSRWERSVSDRIGVFFSYHRNAQVLLDTFDNSNWDFLVNGLPRRPKYILVAPGGENELKKFLKHLKQRFPRNEPSEFVTCITRISDSVQAQFERALCYDIVEGCLALVQQTVPLEKIASNPGRYRRFDNLLIYELEAYERAGSTYCGFIDAARPHSSNVSGGKRDRSLGQSHAETQEFYSRALTTRDTLAALSIFMNATEK